MIMKTFATLYHFFLMLCNLVPTTWSDAASGVDENTGLSLKKWKFDK